MKKINKRKKKNKLAKFLSSDWILPIVIFLIAFALRFIAALKIPWRPDEIVYVDWIGKWFSTHFWLYLFQFYHTNYPPQSDIFGNPPLAMWIMTLGIYLAKLLHFSELLGARMINVIIGSFTAVAIFGVGKKWFNFTTGLIAALGFVLVPIIITNNATAYIDTLLALFILLSFHFLMKYLKEKNFRYLLYLAFILGLSFLTKFMVVPVILAILIILPIYARTYPKFWSFYFISIIVSAFTAITLWAGLRDPNQISEIYWLYKSKIYSPYAQTYSLSLFNYYLVMLIGILPPVIVLGALINTAILIKAIINKKVKSFQPEIILTVLIVSYLIYNSLFAKYGGAHQLIPLMPLILIFSAIGIVKIIEPIKNKKVKTVVFGGAFILLALPLTGYIPKNWGLYNNIFVGGPNYAYKIYSVGIDNEGIQEIADYVNQNTPEGSQVIIVGYDWILDKYLTGNRRATALFLNEGLVGAVSKGGEYVVIPRVFLEGTPTKTKTDFNGLEPIKIIQYKNTDLAKIYKIDYSRIKLQKKLDVGNKNDWDLQGFFNEPNLEIANGEIKISYNFTNDFSQDLKRYKSKIILTSKKYFIPANFKGLFFEVYADGSDKNMNILLNSKNNYVLENDSSLKGQGWRPIYVAFRAMNFIPLKDENNLRLDSNEPLTFNLEITSNNVAKGELKIRNIYLCTDDFSY